MKLTKINPEKYNRSDAIGKVPEPNYPSFYIDLKNFPQAKDWEVGKKYSIEMTVRQASLSQNKNGSGSASFDILEIGGEDADEEESEETPEEESSEDETIEKPNYSRIK